MNNTSVNVQSSYPTKHVFSKGTAVAMSVTLFILAAVLLGRSICAMIYSQRLSVCQSLYQIFGTGSVPIVNIVVGVVTACLLVFLAIGLFSARSGANSNPPMTAGLSFLKIGLIISIVYTSLAVITSFASVSIVNMNPEGYIGFINISATGQFILTLFFGIAMICGEAAMLRLCSAMTTNLQSGAIVKKGAGMAFLAGVVGVVTGAVAFFIKLFRLVAPPKDYLQNIAADKSVDGITSADMLLNAFNVLIFAAVAATVGLIIACVMSYLLQRTRIRGRTIPNFLITLGSGTPSVVIALGLIMTYQNVNSNIYNGTVPPVPQAPENPFMPKTQYPNGAPVQQNPAVNPAVNPAYPTEPSVQPGSVNPSPFAQQAVDLHKPSPGHLNTPPTDHP